MTTTKKRTHCTKLRIDVHRRQPITLLPEMQSPPPVKSQNQQKSHDISSPIVIVEQPHSATSDTLSTSYRSHKMSCHPVSSPSVEIGDEWVRSFLSSSPSDTTSHQLNHQTEQYYYIKDGCPPPVTKNAAKLERRPSTPFAWGTISPISPESGALPSLSSSSSSSSSSSLSSLSSFPSLPSFSSFSSASKRKGGKDIGRDNSNLDNNNHNNNHHHNNNSQGESGFRKFSNKIHKFVSKMFSREKIQDIVDADKKSTKM